MVDQAGMNSPVAARISIQLFVAAAFLAAFGALNSSQDGTSLVPALLLAAVCAGAGFAVRTGTPNGRLIGLVAAGGTVAYGVISLFSQHYLPGSVIATFALFRLATSGSAFADGPPTPAPPATHVGQGQQTPPAYGQPAFERPQPGLSYGQPPVPPAAMPPTSSDPRFG